MRIRKNRILLIGLTLLILVGVADATFLISEGVSIETGNVIYNYTILAVYGGNNFTINNGFVGTEIYSMNMTSTNATAEILVHNVGGVDFNITHKPNGWQRLDQQYYTADAPDTRYVYLNRTYIGNATINESGYCTFYTPYTDSMVLWEYLDPFFVPTTTTTTILTTTTTTTLGVTTTTTLYNGSYERTQESYLNTMIQRLNQYILSQNVQNGMCQLQIDNESFYGSPEIDVIQFENFYMHDNFLNTGYYYGRVRCYDRDMWGVWSKTREFNHTDTNKVIKIGWTNII